MSCRSGGVEMGRRLSLYHHHLHYPLHYHHYLYLHHLHPDLYIHRHLHFHQVLGHENINVSTMLMMMKIMYVCFHYYLVGIDQYLH